MELYIDWGILIFASFVYTSFNLSLNITSLPHITDTTGTKRRKGGSLQTISGTHRVK